MNELMHVQEGSNPVAVLIARRQMINEVMTKVMQKGSDFDTIPGCGKKPVLLKAGAEKLCSLFGLAPEIIVQDESTTDACAYRVTVKMMSSTGTFLGQGVGCATSAEKKWNWREGTKAEFDAAPEDRRNIKRTMDGETYQVRTNPADQANTVLKMAKKRALVDATLTVTAASDLFTQDIEEFDEAARNVHQEEIKPPSRKAPKAPEKQKSDPTEGAEEETSPTAPKTPSTETSATGSTETTETTGSKKRSNGTQAYKPFEVLAIGKVKEGSGKNGPWKMQSFLLKSGEGAEEWVSTFDTDVQNDLASMKGQIALLVLEKNEKGFWNIASMKAA